jgi:hypothetical protein
VSDVMDGILNVMALELGFAAIEGGFGTGFVG